MTFYSKLIINILAVAYGNPRNLAPVLIVIRQGLEDIDLNNIQIPKGTNIEIPIPIPHQLPDIQGTDALDFNLNLRHLVCKSRHFSTGLVGINIAL